MWLIEQKNPCAQGLGSQGFITVETSEVWWVLGAAYGRVQPCRHLCAHTKQWKGSLVPRQHPGCTLFTRCYLHCSMQASPIFYEILISWGCAYSYFSLFFLYGIHLATLFINFFIVLLQFALTVKHRSSKPKMVTGSQGFIAMETSEV